jgi:hypothetical protein
MAFVRWLFAAAVPLLCCCCAPRIFTEHPIPPSPLCSCAWRTSTRSTSQPLPPLRRRGRSAPTASGQTTAQQCHCRLVHSAGLAVPCVSKCYDISDMTRINSRSRIASCGSRTRSLYSSRPPRCLQ